VPAAAAEISGPKFARFGAPSNQTVALIERGERSKYGVGGAQDLDRAAQIYCESARLVDAEEVAAYMAWRTALALRQGRTNSSPASARGCRSKPRTSIVLKLHHREIFPSRPFGNLQELDADDSIVLVEVENDAGPHFFGPEDGSGPKAEIERIAVFVEFYLHRDFLSRRSKNAVTQVGEVTTRSAP